MADQKISARTLVTSIAGTEDFPCVQAGSDVRARPSQLAAYLQSIGTPRVWAVNSDHAISSTTATEVTQMRVPGGGSDVPVTLEAGTYIFQYNIMAQSATTSVGVMFGINFTGTAANKVFKIRAATTGTTAISGVVDDQGATTGQTEESVAQNAYSTTAPNLGFTGGVATANANCLYIIEGLIIVTVSGDLELWHGSETATSTTVKAGSSLMVIRTA